MKNIFLAFMFCFLSLTGCDLDKDTGATVTPGETIKPPPSNPDPGNPTPGNPNPGHTDKLCFLGSAGNGSSAQINVAKAMLEQNCKEVYLLGDLIYPWGVTEESDPLIQTNFFGPYKDLLDKNIPLNLVLGDSDYEGNPHVWMAVAWHNPKLNFPDMYYNHRKEDLCILALDTPGRAELDQVAWLNTTMENAQKTCKFIMAVGHHSYLSVGPTGDATDDVKVFLDTHIVSKAHLYISAQDHLLSDEGDHQGTRFLVSGGGGGELEEVTGPPRTFAKKAFGFIAVYSDKNPPRVVTVNYSFIEVAEDGTSSVVHQGSVTPAN